MKKAKKSGEKLEKMLHQAVSQRDWREVSELAGELFLLEEIDGAEEEEGADMFNDWPHLMHSTSRDV